MPHDEDIFSVLQEFVIPHLDFRLFVGFSSCLYVLLVRMVLSPSVVGVLKPIDCLLIPNPVREPVPGLYCSHCEEVFAYISVEALSIEAALPSDFAFFQHTRRSPCGSGFRSTDFKPFTLVDFIESIQGFECIDGVASFTTLSQCAKPYAL